MKYFQYLLKAVDDNFIFIAPLFTHSWLCRLEKVAVEYLAQSVYCRGP